MPRDRSLDEFLSAGGDGESDDPDDSDPEQGGSAVEPPNSEPEETGEEETSAELEPPVEAASDVEPLATTYASSPDGGECATCGEVVVERWRDGGDLVCEGCKNW